MINQFIFIGFMLSEEDKTTIRSIEYWFKLVDTDNNGIITLNCIIVMIILVVLKWSTSLRNNIKDWIILIRSQFILKIMFVKC